MKKPSDWIKARLEITGLQDEDNLEYARRVLRVFVDISCIQPTPDHLLGIDLDKEPALTALFDDVDRCARAHADIVQAIRDEYLPSTTITEMIIR
jgi:hypothetical protein